MSKNLPKYAKTDEYLGEFAQQSGSAWLATLVDAVLAGRKVPSAPVLDRIFSDFLIESGLEAARVAVKAPVAPVAAASAMGTILSALKHIDGVNAIVPGAELRFHNRLTVIYGKNGSGKSGFARILKRLAGARTQEEIWQNVRRVKSKNKCRASVKYVHDGKPTELEWKGESSIAPFAGMGVFDGKAVVAYLARNLGFSYQPRGFELFQELSRGLMELQDRLAAAIARREKARPVIQFCTDESPAGKFLAKVTARTTRQELDDVARWTDSEVKALTSATKEHGALMNPADKEELLQSRHDRIAVLQEAVTRISADLSPQNLKLFSSLAKTLSTLRAKKKETKGRTLDAYSIPEMQSDEWERFIDAGEAYIDLTQHEHYPRQVDTCIYCLQALSKPAQQLLVLYRDLYRTETPSELSVVEEKINAAIEALPDGSYRATLGFKIGDYAKLLPSESITAAFGLLSAADVLAKQSRQVLKGMKDHELRPLDVTAVVKALRNASDQVASEQKAFRDAQRSLLKKGRELERRIQDFKDLKKLHDNRAVVERFIADEDWIARAKKAVSRLNTRPVTDLGKRAWQDMVSDAFRDAFLAESKTLRAPGVSLEFRGEYGSQMRDKAVEGMEQIDQVLSEGEQKAVALADFLAEQAMRQTNAPLIFDDPAASFDHERKELIAERLVALSATRQVIVFTHDLMFAGYLHERVQRASGDLDQDRAAFHDVRSEGEIAGMITDNYYPGAIRFDAAMKKIDSLATEVTQLQGERRADGLANAYSQLRRAVEKAVEERIFGRVVNRWSDQIQMHNVPKASLSREKLGRAQELHEKFSRYISAHNQSDEMILHALPTIEGLREDIRAVHEVAAR